MAQPIDKSHGISSIRFHSFRLYGTHFDVIHLDDIVFVWGNAGVVLNNMGLCLVSSNVSNFQ